MEMANCSTDVSLLPRSEDYYEVAGKEKKYFLYADVVLTALVLIIYIEELYFVIKSYKHFNIIVKSIWLITIYPVFAVSALVAVLIPRATYLCDFVSACFLSVCFFQFSSLILLYFGHVDVLLAKVKDTGFKLAARPCCCCCVCCPTLPPVFNSLRNLRLMIFQTAIVQPVIQFISAVLWADDKYDRTGFDFTKSYIYLSIVKVVSTVVALYGVNVLHGATQVHLRTHNTQPKYTALQLVQVFFNIQSAIFLFPTRFNLPACDQGLSSTFQMLEWHHLVLVVEMFLLSVLARLYYRRPLRMDAIMEAMSGNLSDVYTMTLATSQQRCPHCHAHAPRDHGDSVVVVSEIQLNDISRNSSNRSSKMGIDSSDRSSKNSSKVVGDSNNRSSINSDKVFNDIESNHKVDRSSKSVDDSSNIRGSKKGSKTDSSKISHSRGSKRGSNAKTKSGHHDKKGSKEEEKESDDNCDESDSSFVTQNGVSVTTTTFNRPAVTKTSAHDSSKTGTAATTPAAVVVNRTGNNNNNDNITSSTISTTTEVYHASESHSIHADAAKHLIAKSSDVVSDDDAGVINPAMDLRDVSNDVTSGESSRTDNDVTNSAQDVVHHTGMKDVKNEGRGGGGEVTAAEEHTTEENIFHIRL